jgi:hypothetical protein
MIKKIINKLKKTEVVTFENAAYDITQIEFAELGNDSKTSLDGLKDAYFGTKDKLPTKVSSVIDLSRWDSFDEYLAQIKKENYKSAFYPFNRSKREGYYSHPFVFSNFIPDIVEVNHSVALRQGREMSDGYKRTIDDFGGVPKEFKELPKIKNKKRFGIMMGVFVKEEGKRQGNVVVDEKLIGYISFKREGNICLYSQILGHGDYLNKGAMYNLHYYITNWVFEKNELTEGIDYMMYASHFDGGDGLRRWKEKLMYEPRYLIL